MDIIWFASSFPDFATFTLSFLIAESRCLCLGVNENHKTNEASGISNNNSGYVYSIHLTYEILPYPNSDKYPIIITFLPPPDGVPIDPIAHPYAIENNNKLDKRVDLSRGKPAFLIKESATGSIIAATVCSPIKEERNAEIEIKPTTILHVLFPVILIIPSASRLSKPWLTIDTASINEPIIKNTASLINVDATPSGVSTPNITCIIKIRIATAGNGMDSEIIKINTIKTIIRVRWPSDDNPSGEGK